VHSPTGCGVDETIVDMKLEARVESVLAAIVVAFVTSVLLDRVVATVVAAIVERSVEFEGSRVMFGDRLASLEFEEKESYLKV
jgi:hypothetical protein